MFSVKENDGLPQNICVRCLGTLEFLCDFYERCHLTQKELTEANKDAAEEKSQRDSDTESDKENVIPPPNDAKHKAKSLSPESPKSTKNCLTLKNPPYYQNEIKEESNNLRITDDNDRTYKVQSSVQTTIQLNNSLVPPKQSTIDNVIIREERSKDEEQTDSSLKCKRSLILEKINVPRETLIRSTRSGPISSINSIRKSNMDGGVNTENFARRKRGRKSKLEKMKEAALSCGMKKKVQRNLDDYQVNTQYKRHCLRAICANSNSNAVISHKPEIEQMAKEQLKVDTVLNKHHDENDESNKNRCTDGPVVNDLIRATTDDKDRARKKEDSVKCKAISVIVKQEKMEIESPRQTGRTGQSQETQQATEALQENPPVGEETNQTENTVQLNVREHSDTLIDTDHENPKRTIFAEQNRVTVIKSSQANEIIVPKKIEEDSIKLNITLDEMDESTKDDLKSDISEVSLLERLRRDSFSGGKNKDKSFGKISELISDEQKEIIETYYTVDMSIVNSEEVKKNITIIDKKNIRCNICNTLYLRMDKCQVHIWGHLQMKPYQCKACDFATVTVSNVRCHIRKSHLKIKPFVCHLCEKRYVTAALLEEHINTHTGARPFKCKVCDFASASRQMLSYHTATHKPMKDVSCKICGKEFFSRGRLRAHMIIHNKDKVVMCKLCSAYLSNAEALETHHRNIHAQDYVCDICGKHVKSRKALHNHQNVHAAAKYKCDLCPNVYKSSQILKEHLLKHRGIRKYKCNVCEKSFGQQSHLAAHMAVHSEIRFHCPACNKAFNRHDNMKIHTKRCKLFLANPSLKDFLHKKDRKMSLGKTDVTEDSKNEDSSNPASSVEDQNEDSSSKIIDDKERTEMNFCKLGLNISCIKSVDQTWTHNDVYSETEEITRPTEINVIQITKVNDKLIPQNGKLTVLENVLRPESF